MYVCIYVHIIKYEDWRATSNIKKKISDDIQHCGPEPADDYYCRMYVVPMRTQVKIATISEDAKNNTESSDKLCTLVCKCERGSDENVFFFYL